MTAPSWFATPRAVALYTVAWSVAFTAFAAYANTIGRGPIASSGWLDGLGPVLFLLIGLFSWRRGWNWKLTRHLLLSTWLGVAIMFGWPVVVRAWTMAPDKNDGPILSWAVPLMAVLTSVGLLLTYAVLPADVPKNA